MKYAVTTLGCKVNQYETQALETLLRERGHVPALPGEADAVIINTCAVTAESGRKSRQAVRHMQNENPGALTVVCGCFSQISPDETAALGADIVYGSGDRRKLVEDIEAALAGRGRIVNVDDPMKRLKFEELPSGAVGGRTRAMLKIQDGCDNFCTYCVIPYARGRVRSLPLEAAAAQAAGLYREGYAEIVVTGIEIASYGKDFHDGTTLHDAVEAVSRAAPGARIHLGSLEPTVVTEDFCRSLRELGNVCPHFHLSVQSGCDGTLRRMNRKYGSKRLLESAELLREYFPGCALTADLITGFPGETEGDHLASLATVERCAFARMHVFPYSVREGTKAAAMDGQVPNAVKEARARQARELAGKMEADYLSSCVGKTLPVLFETERGGRSRGHSGNYCEVCADGQNLRGIVRNVEIKSVSGQMLVGKVV